MNKKQRAEQVERTANAIESLTETLKDSPRLLILTDYSPSGGTRYTRVYAPVSNEIWDITYQVAQAIGQKCHIRDGENTIKGTGWGYSHATYITEGLCRALGLPAYSLKYNGQI